MRASTAPQTWQVARPSATRDPQVEQYIGSGSQPRGRAKASYVCGPSSVSPPDTTHRGKSFTLDGSGIPPGAVPRRGWRWNGATKIAATSRRVRQPRKRERLTGGSGGGSARAEQQV